MPFDTKGEFPAHDRMMLRLRSESDWVPPDGVNMVLPYLEKESLENESDVDTRRRKAQQVMDGYQKIIDRCEEMRVEIEKRCKDVVITVPRDQPAVVDAVRRLFKADLKEITFDMYKQIVQRMAEIGNQGLPTAKGVEQNGTT